MWDEIFLWRWDEIFLWGWRVLLLFSLLYIAKSVEKMRVDIVKELSESRRKQEGELEDFEWQIDDRDEKTPSPDLKRADSGKRASRGGNR